MAINKQFIDHINRINEILKPVEPVRKYLEAIQNTGLKNYIENAQHFNDLIHGKTESDSDYFKDELIKYCDPCDYVVIDFIRNKLNYCTDRKKASDFIIRCISIALNNEKSGVITREKLSQLNGSCSLESVYSLFSGEKTPQESSIIITYLCLYIGFLHKSDLQRNHSERQVTVKIKTHGFYEALLPKAINIINRELSNGERKKATIAKILKRELAPEYHRIPCHNTLLNWIDKVIKSRQK
ncbi:TPA: hypothetical protein ACHGD4_002387 [Escherichia coli]|nr:hypothetical protein [Escherichia coli O146]